MDAPRGSRQPRRHVGAHRLTIPGKGPVYGEMTGHGRCRPPDTFVTDDDATRSAKTGETASRTGKALVYTGFQWRGRGADAAQAGRAVA